MITSPVRERKDKSAWYLRPAVLALIRIRKNERATAHAIPGKANERWFKSFKGYFFMKLTKKKNNINAKKKGKFKSKSWKSRKSASS